MLGGSYFENMGDQFLNFSFYSIWRNLFAINFFPKIMVHQKEYINL
jgi:hypothetical protein